MRSIAKNRVLLFVILFLGAFLSVAETKASDSMEKTIEALGKMGLPAEAIRLADFHEGIGPFDFLKRTGSAYKPSYNEEPSIPAQCWVETGYGTQNACLYCHTDYLASKRHGNAFPLAEDQILYSFPTPNLNRVLWRNTIFPHEIDERLLKEGIPVPDLHDVSYIRQDNWLQAFRRARPEKADGWINESSKNFVLFPALDPMHLFPENERNPTSDGTHGYIDKEGFVRDEKAQRTGWRAVNFFPYGIFTPLSGSVSGIYIRLPDAYRTAGRKPSPETYKKNLELLEKNIKNRSFKETHYLGDASDIRIERGFFPVGTEFAHPLHYVDRNGDGESGTKIDGVLETRKKTYEFPGTRSKRLKEMRYMYKWKEVGVDDINEEAHPEDYVVGKEGQGWVYNNAGWLLAGFIEDRQSRLRPQTTEEMMQCIGCHGKVGNTVDSVWSFQRKLPGDKGWREMDYGGYDSKKPLQSKLMDYVHESSGMGERGFFYHVVVGADLYGVMPGEVADELRAFAAGKAASLDLKQDVSAIFDDEKLKRMGKSLRKDHLQERQKVMRAFVADSGYLKHDEKTGNLYVKANLLYPYEVTMKRNIQLYRKIVLDQSFNLGKDVFGSEKEHVPFTFRSDGTTRDAEGKIIPVGEIITSRPFNDEGKGITPTGIVAVNDKGEPVDREGKVVDLKREPEKAAGHISTGGTFEPMYNPILSDIPISRKNP
ncbi:MAG: hypothetical protein JW836_04395 [Deltaproteobacteria bacterium]|nr:hypothetical protein [Deltaproteobacteria bacterium]